MLHCDEHASAIAMQWSIEQCTKCATCSSEQINLWTRRASRSAAN
jgi:nitrate reductase beta subunit